MKKISTSLGKNIYSPAFLKIVLLVVNIFLFMGLTGCYLGKPLPSKKTPTSPIVEVTAWAALIRGELVMNSGCLQVQSRDYHQDYSLIWPLDFSISIIGDDVTVKSGLVSGILKETVLHIGGIVELGGGTVDSLSSEQEKLNPQNCPGPYWIVGSIVSKTP